MKEFEVREPARRSMMASDLSYLWPPHPALSSPCVYSFQHHCYPHRPFLTFVFFLFLFLSLSLSLSLGTLWHPTPLINIRPRSQEHRQVPLWSASRGDPPPQTRPLVTSTHRLSPNILSATLPQSRPVTLNINGSRSCQPQRATLSPIPTCPK